MFLYSIKIAYYNFAIVKGKGCLLQGIKIAQIKFFLHQSVLTIASKKLLKFSTNFSFLSVQRGRYSCWRIFDADRKIELGHK
jgi:hypothetical protein